MKKLFQEILPDAIPFNEDMSVGTYHHHPFSDDFILERSSVHHVSSDVYKEKLSMFLSTLDVLNINDDIHLYFGEDETCLANREFLIKFLKGKAKSITLHIVDELTGNAIKEPVVYE